MGDAAKKHLDELLKLPAADRSAAVDALLASFGAESRDIPPALLERLLALDASVRTELAQALRSGLDHRDDDGMTDEERRRLDAAIERSIAQADAGETIPVEQALAQIKARRAARAAR